MDQTKLFELIERFKLPLGLLIVGLVLIIGGIIASSSQKPKTFPKESIVGSKTISIDISGAVKTPGVYQLADGSRVEEAVKAAGGFSDQANQEYISKYLNLAQKLSDGTKIYVPVQGENTPNSQSAGQVAGVSAKLNINTASQDELDRLPGVGPTTVTKIISSRPYQAVSELLDKKVVSKAVFEKIKELVDVY